MPTLVMHGDDDRTIPYSDADPLGSNAPQKPLVENGNESDSVTPGPDPFLQGLGALRIRDHEAHIRRDHGDLRLGKAIW
jgi:hypothetical protein